MEGEICWKMIEVLHKELCLARYKRLNVLACALKHWTLNEIEGMVLEMSTESLVKSKAVVAF